MPDDLYRRDFHGWTAETVALLRRLRAGERVNDSLDWPALIEEVEALGRSERRACESLLRQAMAHLLKLHADPGNWPAVHWRVEALVFLLDARRAFAPSMRQHLDLAFEYHQARREAQVHFLRIGRQVGLPPHCPWTLHELLDPPGATVEALLALIPDVP